MEKTDLPAEGSDIQRGKAVRVASTIGILCIAWLILWRMKLRWSSAEEFLWVTILYTLCSIPSVLFSAGHKSRIPFMPMWGLAYFMMFGVPMLSEEEQLHLSFVPESAVMSALGMAALGAMACLLTFYTFLGKWLEGWIPRLRAPWDPRRAPRIGVLLTSVGIVLHYIQRTSSPSLVWSQILYVLSQLGVVGMLTLFLAQLRGLLSLRLRLFLWVFAVPVELLMALGSGAMYNAILILTPFLFCYTVERRTIPWLWLILTAAFLVPFLGLKHEYRSYAWYGEEGGDIVITASPIQRGLAFIQLVIRRLSDGAVETYTVAAETTQARVSHLGVLITVMETTPKIVPFWGGETYRTLLWALAPRILFPNKPVKSLGQEFGHRYGLLGEEDSLTAFNLPHQVVEMYINFGPLGVLIGMGIIGLCYRAVLTLMDHPNAGERSIIIGCGLLSNLLDLDSDFSLVFGGVVYYVAVMYVVSRSLTASPGTSAPMASTETHPSPNR